MLNGNAPRFGALDGSMRDFRYLTGSSILSRVEAFYDWQEVRRAAGVWPASFPRRSKAGRGTGNF